MSNSLRKFIHNQLSENLLINAFEMNAIKSNEIIQETAERLGLSLDNIDILPLPQ